MGYKKALTDIINPGDLDTLIDIKYDDSPGEAPKDNWGEIILPTIATISCKARIDYRSGSEDIDSGRVTTDSNIRFTIRYRSEINHSAYVVYETQKYDIHHIEYHGRKRYMTLNTSRVDR